MSLAGLSHGARRVRSGLGSLRNCEHFFFAKTKHVVNTWLQRRLICVFSLRSAGGIGAVPPPRFCGSCVWCRVAPNSCMKEQSTEAGTAMHARTESVPENVAAIFCAAVSTSCCLCHSATNGSSCTAALVLLWRSLGWQLFWRALQASIQNSLTTRQKSQMYWHFKLVGFFFRSD